jgi:hypothetical protein
MAAVGSSPPRAMEHEARAPDASAPAALPPWVGQPMEAVSDRFLSEGHGEHFDVTVWANAAARDRLDAGAPYPDGAALAERATTHDARGERPAGWLVMDKNGGAWRFAAAGAEGEGASDAGLEACAGCHREADDGVFRWGAPPAAK